MSTPYVIEESQIQPFEFCHQDEWTSALLFRDHLYVLQGSFQVQERLEAYNLSYKLSNMNDILMTVSKTGYRVWANRFADCAAA